MASIWNSAIKTTSSITWITPLGPSESVTVIKAVLPDLSVNQTVW